MEKSADALEQACINRLGKLYALSDWTSDVLDETLMLREYGASCKRDGYDEAIRNMKGVVGEKSTWQRSKVAGGVLWRCRQGAFLFTAGGELPGNVL